MTYVTCQECFGDGWDEDYLTCRECGGWGHVLDEDVEDYEYEAASS